LRVAVAVLLALPSAALRVEPLKTRRAAVFAGATLVPALMLPEQAAYADAIEDIALRSNKAALEAKAAKAKAAEGSFLGDAVAGFTGVVVPAAFVTVLGGAAYFASTLLGQTDAIDVFVDSKKEKRRPLTAAEKRKFANLSPKEKKELGIKDL